MADEVYLMHRRVVRHGSPSTKGIAGWAPDFGETLNSPTGFVVRDASDDEAKSSAQKLNDDVDRRVQELRRESAIKARMEELRREGYRGKD
jgi:hypothetical protein